MGWFSKNNWKSKKLLQPQPELQASKPSFTDPPNVYATRVLPPAPPSPQPGPAAPSGPNRLQRPLSQQPSRPPPTRPPGAVSRSNLPYIHQYAAQSQPHIHPMDYLLPPSEWDPVPDPIPASAPAPAPVPPPAPAPVPAPPYHHHPVIVNQHYYLGPPQQQQQQQLQHHGPPPLEYHPGGMPHQMSPGPNQPNQPSSPFPPPQVPPQHQSIYQQQPQQTQHHTTLSRLAGSVSGFTRNFIPFAPQVQVYDEGLSAWHGANNGANPDYDQIYNRFNNVMTLIDHEKCYGNENDLFDCHATGPLAETVPTRKAVSFDLAPQERNAIFPQPQPRQPPRTKKGPKHKRPQTATNVAVSVVSGNYFSKVELYANSKLPRELPPVSLYVTTWPMLCLAAQYSHRVYDKPTGAELDAHVSGDWLTGTKAMCIKSVPMDHMNTIVFAIRGTASFMDWAVNLNDAPVSPRGFLDDPGNSCHSGFLSVAKKMVKPVAARLRQLLREDPSRSRYSLLITGHSAGGAVAALLYSHMLSETKEAESELNVLSGCFRRVHCITFGTPPVSLLPLMTPDRPDLRRSLFLSFVNEGDPVVRADKAYVRSLLELLACPPPFMPFSKHKDQRGRSHSKTKSKSRSRSSSAVRKPTWKVPACTLSNAGRLIVLRSGDPKAKVKDRKTVRERISEGVVAVTCAEEQLRGMIWGDPVCHL
ncbi:hypothetical protein BGZ63DRAFT_391525, partial [Mariannaea sp. PMI_226]